MCLFGEFLTNVQLIGATLSFRLQVVGFLVGVGVEPMTFLQLCLTVVAVHSTRIFPMSSMLASATSSSDPV